MVMVKVPAFWPWIKGITNTASSICVIPVQGFTYLGKFKPEAVAVVGGLVS